MCTGVYLGKSDPAAELAHLFGVCTADSIRDHIRTHWELIIRLAHQIHDEETSKDCELKRAAELISNLSATRILSTVRLDDSPQIIEAFKLLARKVLEIK